MVSVRRVAPVLLLAIALPLFGARKASHPPRELHRVGDHWTAYNPPDPSTYPPNAKTVAIKQGDTLWALAKQLFGNAYLWPQLWESNTWITDAHWIYPGDVLLVEGEVHQAAGESTTQTTTTTGSRTTTTTAGGQQAMPTVTPAAGGIPSLSGSGSGGDVAQTTAANPLGGTASVVPVGSEYDVYCFGYLGDPREVLPNRVTGFEDADTHFEPGAVVQEMGGGVGDLVFIDGGTATGLVAGETYLAVTPETIIAHPETKSQLGQHYQYRGQIKILCADERHARGIITQACYDVKYGSRLKPLPQIPIPVARIPNMPSFCDPQTGGKRGYIVNAEGGWSDVLGEGILVEVNLGRDDAVQPGDFLTVWRPSLHNGQPNQVLGEIGILTTEGHTATGRIVASRYSMRVGDRVEAR
jgi:hypothetical protein